MIRSKADTDIRSGRMRLARGMLFAVAPLVLAACGNCGPPSYGCFGNSGTG